MYHHVHNIPAVLLRLTNIYGPRAQMRHPRYGDKNGCVQFVDPNQDTDNLNLSPIALEILPRIAEEPAERILSEPIADTTYRERYFPRPAQLDCEQS